MRGKAASGHVVWAGVSHLDFRGLTALERYILTISAFQPEIHNIVVEKERARVISRGST